MDVPAGFSYVGRTETLLKGRALAERHHFASVAGENHLRCTLTDVGGGRLNAIAFRSLDTELGQALINHDGASFHIAGKLRANTWKGRTSAQLVIDDAARAE